MPHHIHVRDIPMTLRRPRLTSYLAQVRTALADPSLPPRARERLEAKLRNLQADLRGVPR
jgi:hypothetical protein